MSMSYKKRDKGNWNQGKSYKGTRKAKEREYVKQEVQQQIDEQDPDYKHRHISKRSRNEKECLRHRINWYEAVIKQYKGWGKSWTRITHGMGDTLDKLKKKWKEKY